MPWRAHADRLLGSDDPAKKKNHASKAGAQAITLITTTRWVNARTPSASMQTRGDAVDAGSVSKLKGRPAPWTGAARSATTRQSQMTQLAVTSALARPAGWSFYYAWRFS